MSDLSNLDLDDLRRDYKYRLEPAKRCESCRHARPLQNAIIVTSGGSCTLLQTSIQDVRRSCCPGWRSTWSEKCAEASKRRNRT